MEDFSFGNVWGDDSSPKPLPASLISQPAKVINPPPVQSPMDDFDDFTDFGQPSTSTSAAPGIINESPVDDEFGDFGDFGDVPVQNVDLGGFGNDGGDDDGFGAPMGMAPASFHTPRPADDWQPLRLHPLPSVAEIAEQLEDLLDPLWSATLPRDAFSFEGIREVEGPGQVLVTPERQAKAVLLRSLYHVLLESPLPPARPPNWTRSRIRRQHLIALGIPINLDEVMPHANGKPLPALQITTRPSSAPPTPRVLPATVAAASGSVTRSSTPKPSSSSRSGAGRSASSALGPIPVLDQNKVDELLSLDAETLPLLPLPVLIAHLDSVRTLTATASSVLTHLLQTREILQQESENYNSAIAALISKETQKLKAGGARSKPAKRGSVY